MAREFYEAVCIEEKIETNPHIAEVLEETTLRENFNLKLAGNNRRRRVQRLSDEDVLVLCRCLKKQPVTGLDVSYNDVTDDGVTHLADLLQCNSTLLSLRLSGNKVGNAGGLHLADALRVNTTLQELELSDCHLGTQSVIALIIVLKSNGSLHSLDISRPLLFSQQEEWAVHCSDMLALNGSLVELHLGKMGMTDSGMERLTAGLRRNHSLRYLDLRCNRVTRDGMHHLAEVLKQNPSLEIIDLSSNRIEDEGAVCLSEAMSWAGCSLKELSVTSNSIRTEGLLALTQAVRANSTLTHIYVWGNSLEEQVCQAFRELVSSGRLLPEHTDVSPYEVDGQVFLAEVFHNLRRRYYGGGTWSRSNPAARPESTPEDQQLVPLQPR